MQSLMLDLETMIYYKCLWNEVPEVKKDHCEDLITIFRFLLWFS